MCAVSGGHAGPTHLASPLVDEVARCKHVALFHAVHQRRSQRGPHDDGREQVCSRPEAEARGGEASRSRSRSNWGCNCPLVRALPLRRLSFHGGLGRMQPAACSATCDCPLTAAQYPDPGGPLPKTGFVTMFTTGIQLTSFLRRWTAANPASMAIPYLALRTDARRRVLRGFIHLCCCLRAAGRQGTCTMAGCCWGLGRSGMTHAGTLGRVPGDGCAGHDIEFGVAWARGSGWQCLRLQRVGRRPP